MPTELLREIAKIGNIVDRKVTISKGNAIKFAGKAEMKFPLDEKERSQINHLANKIGEVMSGFHLKMKQTGRGLAFAFIAPDTQMNRMIFAGLMLLLLKS